MFLTIILTLAILALSLRARARRGCNLKHDPRGIEKVAVWRIGTWQFHCHHAYVGVLCLICSDGDGFLFTAGIALVVSDVIFHPIAHMVWSDPWWD